MNFRPIALALLCAPAAAQSVCQSLNDTPSFLDSVFTGNAWFAIRFEASTSSSIARVELFTGEVTALHQIDLWSHDLATDKPAALLASGSFAIASTNAWQGADLAPTTPLTEGNSYWIVWRAALGAQASLDLPAAQPGPLWTISTDGGASWFTPVQSLDRQWKYRLIGACVTPPSSYCTPGTTTNGCAATLGFSGAASATASSGFTLSANDVEGQKQGLFFYSVSGAQALAWGAGTSLLCVKPPTQRCTLANSGGAPGACDGVLTLDWNAFRAANPSALGAPFAVGQSVWAQAWFRDPPAPKSTSLSDALQFTLAP